MALGSDRPDAPSSWLVGLWGGISRGAAAAVQTVNTRIVPHIEALPERVGLNRIPVPDWLKRTAAPFAKGGRVRKAVVAWYNRQPLVRLMASSLMGRLVISNLIGFVIMFGGILYISLDSGWLINAKREALKIQGEIIAAAVAGDAQVKRGQLVIDPDRMPAGADSLIPMRDDGFAALELSIRPEKVAPMIKRLTRPTNTRARIYDRNGNLVVDSEALLSPGDITAGDGGAREGEPPLRTKDFWTRLRHWMIDREVQVYKEIGSANGQYYPEVRQALQGTDAAMLLINDKGQQIVSVAVPIQRMNAVQGVLLLSTPPGEVDKILADAHRPIWPLAGLALLASIVTGIVLTRTVAGPVKRLSEAAERVSRDINASRQMPDYSDRKDEVGQLAASFAAMTQSLHRRIEASEKFAADVAHELKNPLTAASSTAQSLEYARTEEQRGQLVLQIQQELKRLNRLITDVSSASRLDAELARQSQEPVDLGAVLRSVADIFEGKADDFGCRLELSLEAGRGPLMVSGNDGRIAQVFTNLVDNALSFSPEGSTVTITARRQDGEIVVMVDDQGPGIEPDKLATIFDRFYTYRPTEFSSRGNNSGLGLSISREIIAAHGGTIWAENRPRKSGPGDGKPAGARFVTRLPALRLAQQSGGYGGWRS